MGTDSEDQNEIVLNSVFNPRARFGTYPACTSCPCAIEGTVVAAAVAATLLMIGVVPS